MSLGGVLKRLLGVQGRSVHIAANRLALEEKVVIFKNILREIIYI